MAAQMRLTWRGWAAMRVVPGVIGLLVGAGVGYLASLQCPARMLMLLFYFTVLLGVLIAIAMRLRWLQPGDSSAAMSPGLSARQQRQLALQRASFDFVVHAVLLGIAGAVGLRSGELQRLAALDLFWMVVQVLVMLLVIVLISRCRPSDEGVPAASTAASTTSASSDSHASSNTSKQRGKRRRSKRA